MRGPGLPSAVVARLSATLNNLKKTRRKCLGRRRCNRLCRPPHCDHCGAHGSPADDPLYAALYRAAGARRILRNLRQRFDHLYRARPVQGRHNGGDDQGLFRHPWLREPGGRHFYRNVHRHLAAEPAVRLFRKADDFHLRAGLVLARDIDDGDAVDRCRSGHLALYCRNRDRRRVCHDRHLPVRTGAEGAARRGFCL